MLLILSLLLVGVSLGLFVYLILSPGVQETSSESPHFRRLAWLWPWVSVLSGLVYPFLSWKFQKHLEKQIERAGYKGEIYVKDIVGLQALGAILIPVMVLWILSLLLDSAWMLIVIGLIAFWLGVILPLEFLRHHIKTRQYAIHKAFPFFLDMITLCVEAGSNLQMALMVAGDALADSPLRQELQYVLNEMRAGVNRLEALKAFADRCGTSSLRQWVGSIAQAETLGSSLGPTLRAQAEQFRQERFLQAEKKAAEAPVKLLLPLVVFIFPCTFIVISYPILLKITDMGFF
ncbi:type II secretion system F family protein [Pelistega europaea]|uniref:Type II secretion system F family protein n=1 Tax=Pelistega europaea TaxID=106147 RepID=A0A7Y4P4M6_9BURK|nr:type II secretion system F family protein [Pelistega europaea]